MIEMIEANWPLLLAAFLIGLALAFLVFKASRRTRVTGETGDVLDEGASPAARNQALIDSGPPAASTPAAVTPPPSAAPVEQAPPTAKPAERVAAPPPAPAPVAAPQPVVPPTPAGLAGTGAAVASATTTVEPAGDDLTRIKGVGPKLAARLDELEVTEFAQIAAWDESEIDRVDAELGRFQGRIRRDNWVEQARFLSEGDTAGYEDRFGRLD